MSVRCCRFHNRHCEPPAELCCQDCTEFHHGLHTCPGTVTSIGLAASHHDGSPCVLDFEGTA